MDSLALQELPKKFAPPKMEKYKGATDPEDHVSQYKQAMTCVTVLMGLKEVFMSKGFGNTLEGPALKGYTALTNQYRTWFEDLRT